MTEPEKKVEPKGKNEELEEALAEYELNVREDYAVGGAATVTRDAAALDDGEDQ